MKRDFKGVWIPKEVWLDDKLNWMEKLFLVEIDSLDNENGCFASNKYFGAFFGLSVSRVSEIISSLQSKGYITSFLLMEGKEVKQRTLTLVVPIRKIEGGIRNSEEGYSEKAKDNNTLINNTTNNNNEIYTKKKKFIAPTIDEVILYFKENGYKDEVARKAFNFYNTADWQDTQGRQVKNWKQKMIGVWFKDENKISQQVKIRVK